MPPPEAGHFSTHPLEALGQKAMRCPLNIPGAFTPLGVWGGGSRVGGVVVTWLRDERKAMPAQGA